MTSEVMRLLVLAGRPVEKRFARRGAQGVEAHQTYSFPRRSYRAVLTETAAVDSIELRDALNRA